MLANGSLLTRPWLEKAETRAKSRGLAGASTFQTIFLLLTFHSVEITSFVWCIVFVVPDAFRTCDSTKCFSIIIHVAPFLHTKMKILATVSVDSLSASITVEDVQFLPRA